MFVYRFVIKIYLLLLPLLAASSNLDIREVKETLEEMSAICDARISYNQSWVIFLKEGKFSTEETEVVDEKNRVGIFTQNFTGKKPIFKLDKNSTNWFVDEAIENCEKDIRLLQGYKKTISFVTLLDGDNLQNSIDKLFMFFNFAFYLRVKERSKDREVDEKYWLGFFNKKLAKFISKDVSFSAKYFCEHNNLIECNFISKARSRYLEFNEKFKTLCTKTKLPEIAEAELEQVTRDISNIHQLSIAYATNIHSTNNSIAQSFKTLNFYSSKPLEFFKWYSNEFKKLIPKFRAEQEEFNSLESALQNLKQKIFSKKIEAKSSTVEDVCATTAAAEPFVTDASPAEQKAEQEIKEEVETYIISRPIEYYLQQDDDEDSSSDEELRVEEADILESVSYINKTGDLSYKKLLKKINKDFGKEISLETVGNKTILRLRHNGKLSCAFYDTPHGTQLKKDFPHWRIAIKDMFKRAAITV